MNTKLFAPAALAVALGLSSFSAGAAAQYESTPAAKAMPMTEFESPPSRSVTAVPPMSSSAKYDNGAGAEYAPKSERPAATERAPRFRIGPAPMFNLREAAGG